MTLLITVFAAVIATGFWYFKDDETLNLGIPALLYWAAALMWSVDAVFEYMEMGAEYFVPAPLDMLNDAFLGFASVAFGLIIWIGTVLVKDPRGVVKRCFLAERAKNEKNTSCAE